MLDATHNALVENALQTTESVQTLIKSSRATLAYCPDTDPGVVQTVELLCTALESVSRMFANSTAQAINYSEMLDEYRTRVTAILDKIEGK